jgi:hypothetical protein
MIQKDSKAAEEEGQSQDDHRNSPWENYSAGWSEQLNDGNDEVVSGWSQWSASNSSRWRPRRWGNSTCDNEMWQRWNDWDAWNGSNDDAWNTQYGQSSSSSSSSHWQ